MGQWKASWMVPTALAAVFFAAGCRVSVNPTPTIAPTSTALPTPAVSPEPTTTPVPTEIIVPSPTPEGCLNPTGTLVDEQLASDILGEPLLFRVYLPPCYSENPGKPYPVLYLLHGQQQDATLWESLGVYSIIDELIRTGESQPFLIVMPTERHFLLELQDTDYDRVIAEELVPAIDEKYPTCTDRSCRAVGGISRGGAWAVRVGFSYPQTFHFIGAHSPAVFGGDIGRLPTLLRELKADEIPHLYLDTGRQDDYRESAIRLESILTQLGVPHEWHFNEGQHTFDYWQEHMPGYLLWYTRNWQ